ncbi:unconventional myosin-Va [Erpetoichthys calabaricus]|uniref:unconventional myosin-Va n=1 Tax=Erpetoichthys calabaricus TaxID=27687 RepID=UPI0022348D67|nr:unconventional myosin-Va [Erpetoichthys calabaricus]
MPALALYTKGTRVWIPDPEEVWIPAKLSQDFKDGDNSLLLQLGSGMELHYSIGNGLPPLRNPDILEGENDLTALSYLHEPAVLHNLHIRFLESNSIYTYCGIVLVAINPYESLPIYGEEVIDAYSGQNVADMDPHIFSVAEEAYRQMTREQQNQSIIVSGESGAGKTVTAKFAMRYFATVGGTAQESSVEDRVLATCPIMEAIGNAKTTRNDNSSRFGKYIEIDFGPRGDIVGASMRTYLLEKSRVIFQAPEERNYHIFYQMCAARHLPEFSMLGLRPADEFHYTNQGGRVDIPGVDDASELELVRNSLSLLGVRPAQQASLFQILAGILYLGNVDIRSNSRDAERSTINPADNSLHAFSQLLGVEQTQMAHWLCHRKLQVAGETLVKPIGFQQACEARDALAKHIYDRLFAWTVERLNRALQTQHRQTQSFIGVLDIYGFEMFQINSFEQFCINYANEKLQQQFTQHVFKLEQEEYLREGITWNRIDFRDNQPCIELIEGKLGILELLDEECKMPKGSDASWAQKLYEHHVNHSQHFQKPRLSNSAFLILHFADMVEYQCEGFLEKNRDTMFEEPINILRASKSEFVAELFPDEVPREFSFLPSAKSILPTRNQLSSRKAVREHKHTVSFQFRQSLHLLMNTLNLTTPHYIRCIKPNDLKKSFLFDPKRVVQQLRACGILETIWISAAGYPSRWTYLEFYSRYWPLFRREDLSLKDPQSACRNLLGALILDSDLYQFGKSKIFFRAGQVAYLERLRAERLCAACILIQAWVRGQLVRKRYQRTRKAAMTLQTYCRGFLARRLAQILRWTRAALVIQKNCRMVQVRRPYLLIRAATTTLQAYTRGALARRMAWQLRMEKMATILTAYVRGWLARRWFQRIRSAVIYLQCCCRRMWARRELRQLRIEARSVERYRELNRGMEVKLMQLQLKADEQARENKALKDQLQMEKTIHCKEVERLQGELSRLQVDQQAEGVSEGQAEELAALRSMVTQEREERRATEERHGADIARLSEAMKSLELEKCALIQEKEDLHSHLVKMEQEMEDKINQQVTLEKTSLSLELEEERRRYQGLLKEFSRLEQRYENLKEEMAFSERVLGHRRTPSSMSLNLDHIPETTGVGSSLQEPKRKISMVNASEVNDRRDSRVGSLHFTAMDSLKEAVGLQKDEVKGLSEEDLRHAYDAVCVANRILEAQLASQRSTWDSEINSWRLQVQVLREEMDRQSQAHARLLQLPPGEQLHRGLQDQLTWLTADNLDLLEQLESQEQVARKLRRELNLLRSVQRRDLKPGMVKSEGIMPHKAVELQGLLSCQKKDETQLLKNLVTNLCLDTIRAETPGLPAHILFLCMRHADACGEEVRAQAFCFAAVTAIKGTLKKHPDDVEITSFWLSNAILLLNLLRHFSSKVAASGNINEEGLLSGDFSDQCKALADLIIQAYQQLIRISESRLHPMIVPAMLECEAIPGLLGSSKGSGFRRRMSSSTTVDEASSHNMDLMLQELSSLHANLSAWALPLEICRQAFRQFSYMIATLTLNNMLLRRDMCSWSKGLQIRYNISQLEDWLRGRSLHLGGTLETLEPLIQAAQLLQVSKRSESDAESIVQTCTALSAHQIVKILSLYSPLNDYEERVTLKFIHNVQSLLKNRSEGESRQHLLMDVKHTFPVTFPYFPPSHVRSENLHIPENLKLSFLQRV